MMCSEDFSLASSSKFSRTREDFVCEHCGFEMKGNGYTNHCLKCLWSKHVDVAPGDRKESCGGMMEPIRIDVEKGVYKVVQRCVKCGFLRRNRIEKEDDFDTVLKIVKKAGERLAK